MIRIKVQPSRSKTENAVIYRRMSIVLKRKHAKTYWKTFHNCLILNLNGNCNSFPEQLMNVTWCGASAELVLKTLMIVNNELLLKIRACSLILTKKITRIKPIDTWLNSFNCTKQFVTGVPQCSFALKFYLTVYWAHFRQLLKFLKKIWSGRPNWKVSMRPIKRAASVYGIIMRANGVSSRPSHPIVPKISLLAKRIVLCFTWKGFQTFYGKV